MSFLETVFASTQPSSTPDPFADIMAASEADHRAYHERRQPSINSATAYWRDNLSSLSDQQATATRGAIASTFGETESTLKRILRENAAKLELAYTLLLQHSDVSWGAGITDEALKALDRKPRDIRRGRINA